MMIEISIRSFQGTFNGENMQEGHFILLMGVVMGVIIGLAAGVKFGAWAGIGWGIGAGLLTSFALYCDARADPFGLT